MAQKWLDDHGVPTIEQCAEMPAHAAEDAALQEYREMGHIICDPSERDEILV